MAIKQVFVDDLDGSDGAETISFAYRGTSYEIDLNEKNSAAFDKAVAKFIDGARRSSAGSRSSSRRSSPPSATGKRSDLAQIREWAAAQGIEVSSRGRIAAEVIDAYDAAN